MKNNILATILFLKKFNEAQYICCVVVMVALFVFSQNGLESGMVVAGFIVLMVACYYTVAKPLETIINKLLKEQAEEFYSIGWMVRLAVSFLASSVALFVALNKLGLLVPAF